MARPDVERVPAPTICETPGCVSRFQAAGTAGQHWRCERILPNQNAIRFGAWQASRTMFARPSIGFAPREAISGDFLDGMTRENFRIAHDISAYSFPALAKAAQPMLSNSASLLTLSYLGAERAIPNYNTMGLAKASLEASVRY